MMNLDEVAGEIGRGWSNCSSPTRRSAALLRQGPAGRTIRTGADWCFSTSIFTATPARDSGPATRRAGPLWYPVCWKIGRSCAVGITAPTSRGRRKRGVPRRRQPPLPDRRRVRVSQFLLARLTNKTSLANDANRSDKPVAPREAHMGLVSSFVALLQPLTHVMTGPRFENLVAMLTGWASRQANRDRMFEAAGTVRTKHHGTFIVCLPEPNGRSTEWAWPFSVCWRHGWAGRGDVGVGRYVGPQARSEDVRREHASRPARSRRGKATTNWGHSWVVLGVVVRFSLWPQRTFCLPILFRLYLTRAEPSSIVALIEHVRSWAWRFSRCSARPLNRGVFT